MLNRPIASGLMLAAVVTAFGGTLWQQTGAQAGVEIQRADVDTGASSATRTVPTIQWPERTATAPARVVDSAGFPVVPTQEAEPEPEVADTPIVTINGRPLGSSPSAAPAASERTEVATRTPAAQEPTRERTVEEVVASLPSLVAPRPIPRPEGLQLPPRQAAQPSQPVPVDYGTVTASTSRSNPDYLTFEERQRLAPIPNVPTPAPAPSPREDGLVEVIGDNGEVIWLYEEQVRDYYQGQGSRVVAPTNEFGFVYDEYDW
jgi:hypothetical protein